MYRLITAFIITALFTLQITGLTHRYKPRGNEPAFQIDIHPQWNIQYDVNASDAILLYSDPDPDGTGYMSVRTELHESEKSFAELMHLVAARLSQRFSYVALIEEKISKYRPNMYLGRWKIKDDEVMYTSRTAFVREGNRVIFLLTIASESQYERYRVIFENAILSLDFQKGAS